jgi:hypothetical protein
MRPVGAPHEPVWIGGNERLGVGAGLVASSGKCLQTHFWQNEPKFYFRLILL